MDYKQAVQAQLKDSKARGVWQKICAAYEEGGNEAVKTMLAGQADEVTGDYSRAMEALKKRM